MSEVEEVFCIGFLVLARLTVSGGVLQRSALLIPARSSLERVDRWLISSWKSCFDGVLLLDENFAWSLAATTSAAAGDGEGAAPGMAARWELIQM